jgi:hypothetical protein
VEAAAAVVPDREAAEEGEPTTKLVAPVVAEEEGLAALVVAAGAPVLMFIAVSLSILVRLTRCSSVRAVRWDLDRAMEEWADPGERGRPARLFILLGREALLVVTESAGHSDNPAQVPISAVS